MYLYLQIFGFSNNIKISIPIFYTNCLFRITQRCHGKNKLIVHVYFMNIFWNNLGITL